MENIKKGLESAICLIKKDIHQTIDNYQFSTDIGCDIKELQENIIARLDTIIYLQNIIYTLNKENELDVAVKQGLEEANKYKKY